MMGQAIGLSLQAKPATETASSQMQGLEANCQGKDCSVKGKGEFNKALSAALENAEGKQKNEQKEASGDTFSEAIASTNTDVKREENKALEPIVFAEIIPDKTLDNALNLAQLPSVSLDKPALINDALDQAIKEEATAAKSLNTQPLSDAKSSDKNINSDVLNPVENEALITQFKQVLKERPENVLAQPLTPESNKQIKQQALALMQQNNPELVVEKEALNRQVLPIDGEPLPLTPIETLKNSTQTLNSLATAQAQAQEGKAEGETNPVNIAQQNMDKTDKVQSVVIAPKNNVPELLESDIGKGEIEAEVATSKEKQPTETVPNKNNVQAEIKPEIDIKPQKLTVEALPTLSNNVMGVNQATLNSPTATPPQTGSTLLLAQNSTPEQWGSALGDKVQWMINTKLESAEIRIDPPHLGKMEISIKMTDDGAQVMIQTQHAATRDIIDAASLRLKEMLEAAGHQQVDVDVSHKGENQSGQQFDNNDELSAQENKVDELLSASEEISDSIVGSFQQERQGLDLFA